jgi:hypothetical protein
MDTLRRSLIAGLCGAVAAPALCRPGGRSAAPRSTLMRASFTVISAPDWASRQALAAPLLNLAEGAPRGVDIRPFVDRNFSRLVDQNFARLNERRLALWVDKAQPLDLANLAQLYQNSLAANGAQPLAFDILAHRLDAKRLARVAQYFGFAPIYQAVSRSGSDKLQAFVAQASPAEAAPTPYAARVYRNGSAPLLSSYADPLLDYTLEEIYLSYRTAPVGSLSVSASLYSTAVYAIPRLSGAFGAGYLVGGFLTWGAARFFPSLWDGIVDSLGGWMYNLEQQWNAPPSGDPIRSPEEQIGQLQREGFLNVFDVEPHLYDAYAMDGGDYGVTQEWAEAVPYVPIGGGGGRDCWLFGGCGDYNQN